MLYWQKCKRVCVSATANERTKIMKISYKITDTARGIEDSDEVDLLDDVADFSTVTYEQLVEAFCAGTVWACEEDRPWQTDPHSNNSLCFWASDENGTTTFEW